MDSLTQLVLGGTVAAAIVPAKHRRAAILAGMALGTLPDLDVIAVNFVVTNPVEQMVVHRSFSHSLFVLPCIAWVLWWFFKRRGKRVAEAPARWFFAILLALMTHPLLDAFTVYGTQLWWPFMPHPTMWSSTFIVDPLYTLWLLLACLIGWFAREKIWSQKVLLAGLVLSSGYLGWSLIAKTIVEREAERVLTVMGLENAPRFSTPLPLNTLLWRVVVMTPQGYMIGDRSVIADKGSMQFYHFPSDTQALVQVQGFTDVQKLQWFNRGFMRSEVVGDQLIVKDLRMGLEPYYSFNFAVAQQVNGQWQSIPTQQLQTAYHLPMAEGQLATTFQGLWQRTWSQTPGVFNAPVVAE